MLLPLRCSGLGRAATYGNIAARGQSRLLGVALLGVAEQRNPEQRRPLLGVARGIAELDMSPTQSKAINKG